MINQKEIVLVSYPFSNFEQKKVRPALVVSNDNLNKETRDCILVPITSNLKEEPHSVFIEQKDLAKGHLIKTSRIKVDRPFCADKNLILKKIGILNRETFEKVKTEFCKLV